MINPVKVPRNWPVFRLRGISLARALNPLFIGSAFLLRPPYLVSDNLKRDWLPIEPATRPVVQFADSVRLT
ncbi:unnamed protein product, partial [Iphiclides podalirius]